MIHKFHVQFSVQQNYKTLQTSDQYLTNYTVNCKKYVQKIWNMFKNSRFLRAYCPLTHFSSAMATTRRLRVRKTAKLTPTSNLICQLKDIQFSPVQFSHSAVSDSSWPHGLQHTRFPCPSPSPGVLSNSSCLSQWCYPTIPSSVAPFSSCPQSFPASQSFPMI